MYTGLENQKHSILVYIAIELDYFIVTLCVHLINVLQLQKILFNTSNILVLFLIKLKFFGYYSSYITLNVLLVQVQTIFE